MSLMVSLRLNSVFLLLSTYVHGNFLKKNDGMFEVHDQGQKEWEGIWKVPV